MTLNRAPITTPRGRFMVRARGHADAPAVVLLHGWPESSYGWEAVASHLDPAWRLIAPDLRGLGDSERTLDVQAYRKLELARDVLALLDQLGVADFILVGHDWGGIVAQELAFLAPERVRKLVVMNIPVVTNVRGAAAVNQALQAVKFIPYWYQYFQMQPELPEAMIAGHEDLWVRHFYGAAGRDGRIPAATLDEYVRCYRIPHTPATGAAYYRAMTQDLPHWAGLVGRRLPMPALVLYGRHDRVIIPANLEHLDDCFDTIRVEQIEAGHFLHEERPAEVAALLDAFFREA